MIVAKLKRGRPDDGEHERSIAVGAAGLSRYVEAFAAFRPDMAG
jgi:hypothetical protein